MKKLVILLLALILPLTAFAESALVKLLPDTTSFMIKAKSIKMVFEQTQLTPDSIFGVPVREFKEAREELKINPFKLSELTKLGIDVNREVALFGGEIDMNGRDESLSVFLAVPVTDSGAGIIQYIKKMIQEEGGKVTFEEKKNLLIMKGKRAKERAYFLKGNGYLIMGLNPEKSPEKFIQKMVAGSSMLNSTALFQQLNQAVSADKDVVMFANSELIIKNNHKGIVRALKYELSDDEFAVIGEDLAFLKAYRGGMLTADLSTKDLSVKMGISIKTGTMVDNIMKGIQIDKSIVNNIPEMPISLIQFGLNPQKIYNALEKPLNLTKELKGMNAALGIDFKKDIVDLLNGSFNAGMYDGISTSLLSYNLVLSIGVNSDAKAKKLIDLFMSKVPKEIAQQVTIKGLPAYVLNIKGMQVYVAVTKNNIIAAMGKNNFMSALDGSKTFLSKIDDQSIKAQISDQQTGLFYINVAEAIKMANNMNARQMDKQAKLVEWIKQIKHVIAASSYKNGVVTGNIDVKTSFKKSFMLEIGDFTKKMLTAKKVRSYDGKSAPGKY